MITKSCYYDFSEKQFVSKFDEKGRVSFFYILIFVALFTTITNVFAADEIPKERIKDGKKDPEIAYQNALDYILGKFTPTPNYKNAIEWLRLHEKTRPAKSDYLLGYIYANGLGVKRDNKMAITYFKRAADKGHPESLYQIGFYYESQAVETEEQNPKMTNEIEKYYSEAIRYYEKASESGLAIAQFRLGLLYYNKQKNYEIARKWLLKASEQGIIEAQIKLIKMYMFGQGLALGESVKENDYIEAWKWCFVAEAQGADADRKTLISYMEKRTNLRNVMEQGLQHAIEFLKDKPQLRIILEETKVEN